MRLRSFLIWRRSEDALGKGAFRTRKMGLCLEGRHPVPFGRLISLYGPAPTFSFRFPRPSGFFASGGRGIVIKRWK